MDICFGIIGDIHQAVMDESGQISNSSVCYKFPKSKQQRLADVIMHSTPRIKKGEVHLILPVTKDRLSSLLDTQNDINFGLGKTCVKP